MFRSFIRPSVYPFVRPFRLVLLIQHSFRLFIPQNMAWVAKLVSVGVLQFHSPKLKFHQDRNFEMRGIVSYPTLPYPRSADGTTLSALSTNSSAARHKTGRV